MNEGGMLQDLQKQKIKKWLTRQLNLLCLCLLSRPWLSPSLSLQLQEGCLRPLWTAKSTKGGLSVSFFWPAPDSKSEALPKRSRVRKRRPKATKSVPAMLLLKSLPRISPIHLLIKVAKSTVYVATQTPISANHGSASPPSSQQSHCIKKDEIKTVHNDDEEIEMIESDEDRESEEKSSDGKEADQE